MSGELVRTREATVVWGANNIYTVQLVSGEILPHRRIKGKILGSGRDDHNPLAPGDRVSVEEGDDPRILTRSERRNRLARWNRKSRSEQTVAANVDLVIAVTSCSTPPYKQHFVDRVLAIAAMEQIPALCVVNKSDLACGEESVAHRAVISAIGYTVLATVATAGGDDSGITTLRTLLAGRTTVLFGQSGVGKSTLVNAVVPGARERTATVSDATLHGRHTTTRATLIPIAAPDGGALIDTPGVRELDLRHRDPSELAGGFVEFVPFIPDCRYPGCSHLHEPDCAVRAAVDSGTIHPQRYRSYCRLAEESIMGGVV